MSRRPRLHIEALAGIDEAEFDDLIVVDPREINAPSRRSDRDLDRMLTILDSLDDGKDGQD